jgi:PAS domain S-box-containing protein
LKDTLKKTGDKDYLRFLEKEKIISDKIINNSRTMISVINRDYIYEKVNNAFCDAHKVMMDSMVGKTLSDIWGDETFRNSIKENLDLCFSGQPVKYEASFNIPHSGTRHFEVTFHPISFGKGKITHLLAETIDIHESIRSHRTSSGKDEELSRFETDIPIGLLRCDAEGNIMHANRALLTIMKCSEESTMLKYNLKSLYPEEKLFELHLHQLLESKTKTFPRVTLLNCAGAELQCRISGFTAYDESDQPLFIDLVIEDSSREFMLENRLMQAQKLETVGTLAGGIAHDFNNILSAISGYSELIHEDLPGGSPLRERVNKIQGAVVKAQSLVNQIYNLSRHVEREKIPVNVCEVSRETIEFIKSVAPPNIVVKSHILKKETKVFADPTQLFRAFVNIMTNAIQSMKERGGTLSVNISLAEGMLLKHNIVKPVYADEYVKISFEDTGKGVEPSMIKKIFEPFYTTHETAMGTGLGLSVVHGIVSELEGIIIVSSEKHKGSFFDIFIPVYEDNASHGEASGKRILIITDNKYISSNLILSLERSGYEVKYVFDDQQLIRSLSYTKEQPDLIIYLKDSKAIKLSELPGIYNKFNIKIPTVLLTETHQEIFEEKFINSGIIEQNLVIPVSIKEVKEVILNSIHKKKINI